MEKQMEKRDITELMLTNEAMNLVDMHRAYAINSKLISFLVRDGKDFDDVSLERICNEVSKDLLGYYFIQYDMRFSYMCSVVRCIKSFHVYGKVAPNSYWAVTDDVRKVIFFYIPRKIESAFCTIVKNTIREMGETITKEFDEVINLISKNGGGIRVLRVPKSPDNPVNVWKFGNLEICYAKNPVETDKYKYILTFTKCFEERTTFERWLENRGLSLNIARYVDNEESITVYCYSNINNYHFWVSKKGSNYIEIEEDGAIYCVYYNENIVQYYSPSCQYPGKKVFIP